MAVVVKWLLVASVACYLVYRGLTSAAFGPAACGSPSRPVLTASGTIVGEGLRTLQVDPPSPGEVRAEVDGFLEAVGMWGRSLAAGFAGEPVPERVATWEAQAVSTACGVPTPTPGVLLASLGRPGAWGGHQNGRIPAPALCSPRTARGELLRCDAAAAFDRLSEAYRARFGVPISVTDSYRSYEGQVACRAAKGSMCATPGTSNHGWGLAVDLGGGVQRFGTPQHEWMVSNGPAFGWMLPSWARRSGNLPEPWHYEFGGTVNAG